MSSTLAKPSQPQGVGQPGQAQASGQAAQQAAPLAARLLGSLLLAGRGWLLAGRFALGDLAGLAARRSAAAQARGLGVEAECGQQRKGQRQRNEAHDVLQEVARGATREGRCHGRCLLVRKKKRVRAPEEGGAKRGFKRGCPGRRGEGCPARTDRKQSLRLKRAAMIGPRKTHPRQSLLAIGQKANRF